MHKNRLGLLVAKNSFVDDGNGVVKFPGGLVITDDSVQKNGTRYDIPSMDLTDYRGHLTVDHSMEVQGIVGKTFGLAKRSRDVVIEGIEFALSENPMARLAYNLLTGGYLTDFSIETIGSPPDAEGVYRNARLINLSAVTIGNNDNATINQLVLNTIEQAKKDGLNTSELEQRVLKDFKVEQNHSEDKESEMKYKTVKNSRDFQVQVSYKNAAGEVVKNELNAGESIDVPEDQAEGVEKQIEDAEAPKEEADEKEADNSISDLEKVINKAVAPLTNKIAELEKNAFNKGAKEPEFAPTKNAAGTNKEIRKQDWRQRVGEQINAGWEMLKSHNADAANKLKTINGVHLEMLQEKGVVSNSLTLSDFGNFVISPELLSEIEGFRSDYSALLAATPFRDTLSTQFAWLKRSGDVNMQEVEMCDDDADGNLKPISEYSAGINTANMHELAAVTPVCNAATRFLAADLLGDVSQGYRTDYDRKKAQLVIARLQQAVNSNGNVVTYATTSNTAALQSWLNTMGEVSEVAMNGTYIFSYATYVQLLSRAIAAGISGPLSQLFTTGNQQAILGRPYIVVPNDLMPALDTATTRSFTVEGSSVTINNAVFYADLSSFTGRTSGGLMYDLSTEAAYEDGETVKSAFQRNELLLRGSFFRNGAIRDTDKVAALAAPGVS